MSRYDLEAETYDTQQVMRLTGASRRQVRYWRHLGIAVPHVKNSNGKMGVPNIYSAADVDRIRKIMRLIAQEGSLQKARRVLAADDRLLNGAAGR